MLRAFMQKDAKAIIAEWDALAQLRYAQITNGIDVTYNHILMPSIIDLSSVERVESVLDAGCGVGVLTERLSCRFGAVTGLDPSHESISIAAEAFPHCSFINDFLETFSFGNAHAFDLVVANMVLMDVVNLNEFLKSVVRVIRSNGLFVFSITHPCFWPRYYGYENERWFRYQTETIIEAPFRISGDSACELVSTHIHRPLTTYMNHLNMNNLFLEELLEPMPSPEIQAHFASPWSFPRYLLGRCRLTR